MARLIDWPVGLGLRAYQPVSGPTTVNSGMSTTIAGFAQGFSSPHGAWVYQFTAPICKDATARRLRGWIAAQHGGTNAVRVPWNDPDAVDFAEAGIGYSPSILRYGNPWDTGQRWANGLGWAASYPIVAVAANAAKDISVIRLQNAFWGYHLDIGDEFGFVGHFGKYMVTQVLDNGTYRIWPPLRKTVITGDLATLRPIMAMRLTGEGAASLSRGLAYMEESIFTMIEVFDYDVRSYFTD